MSMYEETFPATLLGGPQDGVEVDVTDSTVQVKRSIGVRCAAYIRIERHLFQFVGYDDLPVTPKPDAA